MEEKKVNVLSFDKVKRHTNKEETVEDYFSQASKRVTRGELEQILTQILGNLDRELLESFNRVVITHNLVEVLVQALVTKGIISDSDLSKAQEELVKTLSELEKEGSVKDGSK